VLTQPEVLVSRVREKFDADSRLSEEPSCASVVRLLGIWEYRHPIWARKALNQWCALAQASGIPVLATFADTRKASSTTAATRSTPAG
jgi:hypothetical protein